MDADPRGDGPLQRGPFIGIDVAKRSLEIAVEGQSGTRQAPNDLAGRRRLVQQLQRHQPMLIVLEASGGYEQALLEALWAAQLPAVRVNPRRVREFARAAGRRAKTDAIDAQVLVHFAQAVPLTAQAPPDPARRELAQLQAHRDDLVGLRVAQTNRLGQTADPTVRASLERTLACLRTEIAHVEAHMDALIAQHAELRAQAALLQSVPGIGAGSVRLLLGALPELGRASPKALAALVGVAPYNHDSGALRGQRAIAGGRRAVRSGLYLAGWTAIRHNPVMRAYYQGLRARGKAPQVALIACVRKLLTILNAIVRDGQPWQAAST